MANTILVDKSMQDTRVITGRGEVFGDKRNAVEVVTDEFRSIVPYYPIVLARDESQDAYIFIALFGFEDGENLLLEGDEWVVPYVPVNMRRQPFNVVAADGTNDLGEPVRVPSLGIDVDSNRISKTEGEALFDKEGEPSEFLNEMNRLIGSVFQSTQKTRELAQQLDKAGLIEPLSLGFTLKDGQKHSVGGLFAVKEEKFHELPDETIMEWHKSGLLGSLYAMFASWGQIGGLLQRKNARMAAEGSESTPAEELELPS